MNVNDMVAGYGGEDSRRHGQRRALQCDRRSRRHSDSPISDFIRFDRLPVFMAATPEFVAKSPDTLVALSEGLAGSGKDFKNKPKKVSRHHLHVLHVERLQDGQRHF